MARNPLIEAIHGARYNLETCTRNERAECEAKLNQLLRDAIAASNSSVRPEQLLDALFDDYREFKRAKKQEEWAKMPPEA
jgi:hypothetical protein